MVLCSEGDKHLFLQYNQQFKQAGFRTDDDLMRLQQQERRDLAADFQVLKTKGHKPFFRGSILKFYFNEKPHTYGRSQAHQLCELSVSSIEMYCKL